MLGYSIQQAVYVGTRLFLVMLLPMLGLVVDTRIAVSSYQIMAVSALAGAAALSLLVYLLQGRVVGYYQNVISNYQRTGNFARSFIARSSIAASVRTSVTAQFQLVRVNPEARRIVYQSAIVFAIYGTGVFISFYAALSNFEYRASISQLSGIINSIGTVLLTFFIEPRISRGIDADRPDAEILVHALLLGRLFGVAFVSQLLLLAAFIWI